MNENMEAFIKFFTTWLKVGLSLMYKFCKTERDEDFVAALRDSCQRLSNYVTDDDYHDAAPAPAPVPASAPAPAPVPAPQPIAIAKREAQREMFEKSVREYLMNCIEPGNEEDYVTVRDLQTPIYSLRALARAARQLGLPLAYRRDCLAVISYALHCES